MGKKYYTNERTVQIVLYLLKAYGIKKVIASPGTTNMTVVGSMQQDKWFEMYSCVDERSAAYMACGMAAESGEPVVLTCTGATASRNYMPGLTEAYYRKLPVIAITSTQDHARVGQLAEQVIDRSQQPKDLVVCSEQLQFVETESDEWNVTLKVNRAMHALKKNGGGPIHLNLETHYSADFSVKTLPKTRVIRYYDATTQLPDIPKGKVAIFIGSHLPMSKQLIDAIDHFCSSYSAVVFCSNISNYKGDYGVSNSLICLQDDYLLSLYKCDLLINIGEVSGGEYQRVKIRSKQQWRVNPDGQIRDLFHGLTAVFAMPEQAFFEYYANRSTKKNIVPADELLNPFNDEYSSVMSKIPEVEFSNFWIASYTIPLLPKGCELHLGILNSIRCWNFFKVPKDINVFSNTGGFGIDGDVSTLIGASLVNPERLYFGIVGDLAFFYDMNSVGNRHVANNIRLMIINNGRGYEMNIYTSVIQCKANFGNDANKFMSAIGHFGNKSRDLVKHYAQDLGYEYLSASNKEEFKAVIERFVDPNITDHSIIFEAFTDVEGENSAIWAAHHILCDKSLVAKRKLKAAIKSLLPDCAIQKIKKILGK